MFKIVTTCFNCEKFIDICILSAIKQTKKDWLMYIIDDASTDRSVEVAKRTANKDPRITIIENPKNFGAVFNKTFNFVDVANPEDEDVIITLDGDDFFTHTGVLSYLDDVYSKGHWMTYGGATHSEEVKFADDFYTEINWSKSLRQQRFCLGHLRSHKFFLMKNIKDIDLRYRNGTLFKVPEDIILFLPMAEMCGPRKSLYLKECLYFYRWHSNCDGQIPKKDSHRNDIITFDLSVRKEYSRKTKEQLVNWKCDWSYELKRNIS